MRADLRLVVLLAGIVSVGGGARAQESDDAYRAELAAAFAAARSSDVESLEPPARGTLPPWIQVYFSDFGTDDGGLVGTGDWEWGAYTWAPGGAFCDVTHLELPPTAAYSGTSMWGTTLADCYTGYGNNADAQLCDNLDPDDDSVLSLTVDLRSVYTAWMTWAEWFDVVVAPGFDWVEIRVDGVVVEQRCGSGWDNSNRDRWRLKEIDLTPWAGTQPTVTFHMMASLFLNYSGWYIDDLEVTTIPVLGLVFADGFETGDTGEWSNAVP